MTAPTPLVRLTDRLLIALAIGFAALAASFGARNSDLWLHLATGRLVSSGAFDFASDPFSYTTEGLRWVNHAWLTDFIAYQLFRYGAGWVLVGVKATLLAAAVALGTVGVTRGRIGWSVAVAAVVVAAAISPRATLQPFALSILLLGALLRLLQAGGRSYFAVPLVIALWANLDEWFVLAPCVVVLYWAACRVRGTRRVPHWLPVTSLLACLLTPYHVFGLTLPTELSSTFWASEFAKDPRISPQYAPLFASNPFTGQSADSVAYWGFVATIVTGVLLAWFRRRTISRWEVSAWCVFTGLAVWQARLVPFAAITWLVVFAPHIHDLSAVFDRRRVRWIVRLLALAVVIGFGVLTWSGWLLGVAGRDRALGWQVWYDRSLEEVMPRLSHWRESGVLSEETRLIVTNPDVTNQLYWFAPGVQGYLDTRWELHARSGTTPVADPVGRLGLGPTVASPDKEFVSRFRVGLVLWCEPSPDQLSNVFGGDRNWQPVGVTGTHLWLTRTAADGSSIPELDPSSFSGLLGEPPPALPRLPSYPEWWAPVSGERALSAGSVRVPIDPRLVIGLRSDSLGLPLTSVRRAWSELGESPDDPVAWYSLARATSALAALERKVAPQAGLFAEVRRVQQVTALQQSVVAQPEFEAGQSALAATLAEVGYLDRAVATRRVELRLARRRGDATRVAAVSQELRRLEDLLFDRESLFLVRTPGMSGDPLGRARIALELGLPDLARDVLLQSNPDLYGGEGLRLLASILIGTGQVGEAKTLLDRPEFRSGGSRLGYVELPSQSAPGRPVVFKLPAYDWFRFLIAAATGLTDPSEHLRSIRGELTFALSTVDPLLNTLALPLSNQVVSEVGLAVAAAPLPRTVITLQQQQLLRPVTESRTLYAERADLCVLEAAIRLERGDAKGVKALVDLALDDYRSAAETSVAPAKPLARCYSQSMPGG